MNLPDTKGKGHISDNCFLLVIIIGVAILLVFVVSSKINRLQQELQTSQVRASQWLIAEILSISDMAKFPTNMQAILKKITKQKYQLAVEEFVNSDKIVKNSKIAGVEKRQEISRISHTLYPNTKIDLSSITNSTKISNFDYRYMNEITCTNDFLVSSAVFRITNGNVEVFLVTTHRLWESDTPYTDPKCEIKLTANGTVQMIRVNLTSARHRSTCDLFRDNGMLDKENNFELYIYDGFEMVCAVNVTRIETPKTIYNLVGFSVMRNPQNLRDWVHYHLRRDFSHIVIYDDGSRAPIGSMVHDLVGRGLVTVVDWSFMSHHNARQFTAMQHFAFVFAEMSTWILYMDDDWFFPSHGENNQSLTHILSDALKQGVWQLTVLSYWHGACATRDTAARLGLPVADCFPEANGTASLCPVLDARSVPLHSLFSGRHEALVESISVPSIRNGQWQMTSASFVRTRQHPLVAHIAHLWRCSATGVCNTRVAENYVFRHLKVYDYQSHVSKAATGNWGGTTGNMDQWLALNRDLCQVERLMEPPEKEPR